MSAVNLNGVSMVDDWGAHLLHRLLPLRCLLCGAVGAGGLDLCVNCKTDLPRNVLCCSCCALPLETKAVLCGRCLKHEPAFTAAFVPFRYSAPLDELEARFKFGKDLAAGQLLAQLFIESMQQHNNQMPALIVPVPLHPMRLRERGYNQALELAKPIARQLKIPLDAHLLHRARHTIAQTGLDARERRRNLRGAFTVTTKVSLPSHVALLDDVMTTGATLRECALALKRAGARSVSVWAVARVSSPLR